MKHLRLILLATASIAILLAPGTAYATPHGQSKPSGAVQTGNDVSWPQCGKTLPGDQLFGIVGVNGGLANTTNSCFEAELAWASASAGGTGQDKAALYVNTANPGNLHVADWPTSGDNAYGTCTGGDDTACAYQYGWNMAALDASKRIGTHDPSTYKWWLDVETGNSWETNTANNTADLEGMVDYFTHVGARTGLYSTAYQWNQIAGTVAVGSSLYGLDSWLPGASSLSSAKANCSLRGLTGGTVTVTQYVSKRLDYDYSCI